MERAAGVEPAMLYAAVWKTAALPLSDAREMALGTGVEPVSQLYQSYILASERTQQSLALSGRVERPCAALRERCCAN